MALENPINAYLQVALAQNQNRQQAQQDAMGIGQNLGGAMSRIAQAVEAQKKKQLLQQIVTAMRNQGQPQQGPQPMGVGTGPGMTPPVSGMGAPSPDQSGLINSLMTQYDPKEAVQAHFKRMSEKPTSPWRVVAGMLTKNGKPVQQNELTGEVREAGLDVVPTGRGNSSFGAGSVNWQTASEEEKNTAKGLYEGRIRAYDLGPRDRGIGVKLANEYAIMNKLPPYKSYAGNVAGETAKGFATGKLGMNTLALNTALGHVDSAYTAYENVSNTNQEWLNVPINKLRKSTNDPNIIKLGLTLNALRGELATVFKGSSGTDQDAQAWRDYLTEDLTPSQFNAAIPQIEELLRSRLSALDYQRSSGMTGRGESPLLSPKGASISRKLGSGGSKKESPVVEDGWVYTPGLGGKGNKANWKKQ